MRTLPPFSLTGGLVLRTSLSTNNHSQRMKKAKKRHRIYTRKEPLPVHLTEHILICFNEGYNLYSLEPLLTRIWSLAELRGLGRIPVVVINEEFPPQFEFRFRKWCDDLYLIRGSGQTLDTLRQAQLQKAKAVVVLGSEEQEKTENAKTVKESSADSRVMFTVMTLGYLLGENSDTFVCGVMDSEESMKVCLAPPSPPPFPPPSPPPPRERTPFNEVKRIFSILAGRTDLCHYGLSLFGCSSLSSTDLAHLCFPFG